MKKFIAEIKYNPGNNMIGVFIDGDLETAFDANKNDAFHLWQKIRNLQAMGYEIVTPAARREDWGI